jgi:hypothetical protein
MTLRTPYVSSAGKRFALFSERFFEAFSELFLRPVLRARADRRRELSSCL